jgi:hypothetical protein
MSRAGSGSAPTVVGPVEDQLPDPARREVLQKGAALATLALAGGGAAALLEGCGGGGGSAPVVTPAEPGPAVIPGRATSLGFTAVGKNLLDAFTVPAGYTAKVLLRTGDPLVPAIGEYSNVGTDAAASFKFRFGDCGDGMHLFGVGEDGRFDAGAVDRALLVVNHELISSQYLHPKGQTVVAGVRTVAEEVLKEFYAHGVSVVEVRRSADKGWSYVNGSSFNRRIDALTDILMSGPAGGAPYTATKYSTSGLRTRGTVGDCGHGHTPWGTYLACEENSAWFFRRLASVDDPKRTARERASLDRYGVRGEGQELWATVSPDTADALYGRWNGMIVGATPTEDFRNVANTYSWVVEIDPFDPASTPKKRTALGRFAHEGAWPARAQPGRPLVWYLGDDGVNEHIFKYVSSRNWDPADVKGGMTAGDKYLDDGRLYAARFNADGTGVWLELALGQNGISSAYAPYPFADAADVLVNARHAADAAGATRMDRPEWGAVDPLTGAVYMTLTSNNARALGAADAPNPRYYAERSTQGTVTWGNANGHIIRWVETDGDPAAITFRWDIFLFGARATADRTNVNVSRLDADNDFSMPDGMIFSQATGICWINTDDVYYTDVTNCMTLAALPGAVGDGTAVTITNTDSSGASRQVRTNASYPLGSRLKRFLVGPVYCEMAGLAESSDGRALFVNVMHPGGHWPDGGTARPRSSTVVVTRDDGGRIGT